MTKQTNQLEYSIIEGTVKWADKCREFCRQAYLAAYPNPAIGITEDLFSEEVFSSPRIVKYFQNMCRETADHKIWLAVDNNQEILGVVAGHLHPDYCDMQCFYVAAKHKGQGIGHALYQKVLKLAGSLPIQVDVIEYMADTIAMYEHWGFEIDESKGSLIYNITEWPESARQAYRAIYMTKKPS